MEKRVNEKASVTLADALDAYIKNRGHRLKPTTEKQYRAILQNYSGDWMKQSSRPFRVNVLNIGIKR